MYLGIEVSTMPDESLNDGQIVDHAPVVARLAMFQDSAVEGCVTCTRTHNTALLPSVNTTALGMFCGAKYTHHTFMPIITHHLITTTANKKVEVKGHSQINTRNPTDIKLCISHKNCLFMRSPCTHICTCTRTHTCTHAHTHTHTHTQHAHKGVNPVSKP